MIRAATHAVLPETIESTARVIHQTRIAIREGGEEQSVTERIDARCHELVHRAGNASEIIAADDAEALRRGWTSARASHGPLVQGARHQRRSGWRIDPCRVIADFIALRPAGHGLEPAHLDDVAPGIRQPEPREGGMQLCDLHSIAR